MKKILQRKQIQLKDLKEIEEDRQRVFIVQYINMMNPMIRPEKIFQSKKNVYDFLNQKNISNVNLFVGDVIVE